MAVLQAHDWPGNIRELQNVIERAVLFSPGSVLRVPLGLKQTVT
jgi:DNA-binding NtrC family response regulator